MEEETQVSRMTQCEEDHFEMLVRASNIVGISRIFFIFFEITFIITLGKSWGVINEACHRLETIFNFE